MTCHVGPCLDCGTQRDDSTWRTVMSARHLCPLVSAFVCTWRNFDFVIEAYFVLLHNDALFGNFVDICSYLEGYRMVIKRFFSVLYLVDRDWLIVWILVYCQQQWKCRCLRYVASVSSLYIVFFLLFVISHAFRHAIAACFSVSQLIVYNLLET